MRWKRTAAVAAFALPILTCGANASADTIRFGVTKIDNCAPIAIALAKGYFAAEGLDPQLTFFEAQAPVAVAVASGDLDFGDAAETTALYTLGDGGRLRIIASGASVAPSFHSLALAASNDAYAAGLRTPKDLANHSFALTQMGAGLQYSLGRIAKRQGFDVNTVKLLPLQSNPNIISALLGGRADSAIVDLTNAQPLVDKDQIKLLGWIGDLTGYEPGFLVFASHDMVEQHADTVKRFLTAYRKATRDYYDAFTDPQGKRKDEATAKATLDIIAKWIGQSPETVALGLPYVDRAGNTDTPGMQSQIDWYHSIGAIKSNLQAATLVDQRYATEQPSTRAAAH
jgi:NitT/TauT family transport system substrate-binding protein